MCNRYYRTRADVEYLKDYYGVDDLSELPEENMPPIKAIERFLSEAGDPQYPKIIAEALIAGGDEFPSKILTRL